MKIYKKNTMKKAINRIDVTGVGNNVTGVGNNVTGVGNNVTGVGN